MSVERKLADGMGYEYCILFSRARVALAHIFNIWYRDALVFIPSNICPALPEAIGRERVRVIPVSAFTGLSRPTGAIHVQQYGCRQEEYGALEIDPLMTGWGRDAACESAVISFGYSKIIDLGEGGAYFTDSQRLCEEISVFSDFPRELAPKLERDIDWLPVTIERRRDRAWHWAKYLGDHTIEHPVEQIIPWRVIRRIPDKRDAVVKALREAGFDAGTNYPPLPGVTDPSAIQWGKEVLNLWVTDDYDEPRIKAACEIIKRTIGQ